MKPTKDVRIAFRLTKEESEKLKHVAEHNNMSMSDLIRTGIAAIGAIDKEESK